MDESAHDRARIAFVEEAIAVGVAAARRRRVEHDRATDGRLCAQHDAVAPGRHDRLGQTQLRVAVTDPDDACRDPARPVVHREPCPVGDRLELLEGHLEAIGARKGAGGDEGVSPADVAALDAGQARGDALPGRGTLYRDVVHLNGAHSHVSPGRLEPELVARADGPRPERPRDHRPDTAQA